MLISIIVPVYNAADCLRKCLDSCLAQSWHDFEVVCVDDGSKDCSGAILDEYAVKSSKIKVVHQTNSGVVAARRAAIEMANGEFCYFLDSDDWLPETALADLAAVVDDETDIAFGDQMVIRADCKYVRFLLPGSEWTGVEYVNESLRHVNGYVIGKMIRVDICRRLDIEASMCLNEDLLMNIQAGAMAHKARRIDKANYFYNWVHEGSLSKSQSDASFLSVIAANKHVSELIRSRKEYGFILKDGYIAYLQKNIASALGRTPLPEMDFLVKEARSAVRSAPGRYFAFARRFGALSAAIWLAPLGLGPARTVRSVVVRFASIAHRKRVA